MSRAALALLTLCQACSTTIQGGAAADAPRVVGVSIAGNQGVDDDDITEGLANRGPDGLIRKVYRRLDRLALVQDIARIEFYYRRRGYFSARVKATRIEPADGGVRITFEVDEGEPTRVIGLGIKGLPPALLGADPLAEHSAPLRPGKILRHERYVELKEWLGAYLAHHGYPHAEVSGEVAVDRDRHTAAITIAVDRGPKAVFGATDVRGLELLPRSAVEHRLAYEPGEAFDPAKLELTQGRLYQLGAFSAVRMDYAKRGRPRVTDVHISVTEAKRHEMRLGAGVRVEGGFQANDLQVEVRARADYLMRRFLHPLANLRIDARPAWQFLVDDRRSGPAGEATATVERADLFLPRLSGSVRFGYEAEELEAWSQRGPVVRIALSRPLLGDKILLGLSYRFRQVSFVEVDPAIDEATQLEIGLVDPYRIGMFEESVALDLRDHPIDPSRGFYAQVLGAQGARALGGTSSFTRLIGEVRGYLPLGRRLVLAARALYGRALSGELPITQRFYDGGASGHRGFGFRELSPAVADEEGGTAPIGGQERLLASGEVRVDVAEIQGYPFGVVGFLDAGDVVGELGALDLGHLHYAAGLGLRYDPVIAFRLDVGYRLNRTGPGEPEAGNRLAFHFSLGQAF